MKPSSAIVNTEANAKFQSVDGKTIRIMNGFVYWNSDKNLGNTKCKTNYFVSCFDFCSQNCEGALKYSSNIEDEYQRLVNNPM